MNLRDLQFLLGHRRDLQSQVEGDDAFVGSRKFRALDAEQQARFRGAARGRLFQLREIEEIDLAHPEQADAWLGPEVAVRRSLEELLALDLPPEARRRVRALLGWEG